MGLGLYSAKKILKHVHKEYDLKYFKITIIEIQNKIIPNLNENVRWVFSEITIKTRQNREIVLRLLTYS